MELGLGFSLCYLTFFFSSFLIQWRDFAGRSCSFSSMSSFRCILWFLELQFFEGAMSGFGEVGRATFFRPHSLCHAALRMELSWLFAPFNCRALRSVVFVMAWGSGATSFESSCLNFCESTSLLALRVAYDSWCFDYHSALDQTGDLQETLLDMQSAIFCDVNIFSRIRPWLKRLGRCFALFHTHTHKHQTFFKSRSWWSYPSKKAGWSLVDCICIYTYTYINL